MCLLLRCKSLNVNRMVTQRRPAVRVEDLGRQLRMWRTYRMNDTHAHKMLRLWLGYEFRDLMDVYGRFPVQYFNEIRRRLGFRTLSLLLENVRTCQSFYIVGTDEEHISAFFSSVWHNYEEADGHLLKGSSSLKKLSDSDASKDNIIKRNPTGGNADAFSLERDEWVKRRQVSDYFKWMRSQTDAEHVSVVASAMNRIRCPHDKKGNLLKDLMLTETEAEEVWEILVATQLVPYFTAREEFFKPDFMQHPGNRVHWMKNFFKKFVGRMITEACKQWRKRRVDIEAEVARRRDEAQQQNRPRSPHEWEDADGLRWYQLPDGKRQQIPAEAEPRPSETSIFNYIRKQWQETKQTESTP